MQGALPCEQWRPASATLHPESRPVAAAGSASDRWVTDDVFPCATNVLAADQSTTDSISHCNSTSCYRGGEWDYDTIRNDIFTIQVGAFSDLTLLAGHWEEQPACKNWVMRCWCDYLSGVRCRLFAYGPADAPAIPKPHNLVLFKSRLVLPFWYQLFQVVLEKRPLNRCSSSSNCTSCNNGREERDYAG